MEVHKMRVIALTKRILRQIVRDKRTMGLLIVAPIFVLTMLHFVFGNEEYTPEIGFVKVPEIIVQQMDVGDDAKITTYDNEKTAKEDLAARKIDGYLVFEGNNPAVVLEGSDPSVSGATMKWLQNALPSVSKNDNEQLMSIEYLHGSSEMGMFRLFRAGSCRIFRLFLRVFNCRSIVLTGTYNGHVRKIAR